MTLLAAVYFAGPTVGIHQMPLSTALAADDSAKETQREVADLLERARQAMRDGNLETAESFLSRADAMNASFGLFHVGDTPKKARRDLDKLRKVQARSSKRPSQLFAPGNQAGDQPSKPSTSPDPFLSRNQAMTGANGKASSAAAAAAGSPPGNDADPASGLAARQPFPSQSPFGKADVETPPAEPDVGPRYAGQDYRRATEPPLPGRSPASAGRAESDRLLIAARKALAVGDARQAAELAAQAKALRVDYDFHDDSPDKVEAVIQRHTALMNRPEPDRASESHRRQQAALMMDQAEALLNWKELDEAERLAAEASRLKVVYGPFDMQPRAMLGRIATA
ncbi:MAG: hypothetical protein WD403_11740, partial [Pirellulales bacterium]